MKAMEARKKYFETYVEFEHLIKRIARTKINDYSTNGRTLSEIISAIGAHNVINRKRDGFDVKELLQHKNVRNWLGHSPKNLDFKGKNSALAHQIFELNKKLKKFLK